MTAADPRLAELTVDLKRAAERLIRVTGSDTWEQATVLREAVRDASAALLPARTATTEAEALAAALQEAMVRLHASERKPCHDPKCKEAYRLVAASLAARGPRP